MFLCLPDLAPLAVGCLASGGWRSAQASRREESSGRFSDDHDPLTRSVRCLEKRGAKTPADRVHSPESKA